MQRPRLNIILDRPFEYELDAGRQHSLPDDHFLGRLCEGGTGRQTNVQEYRG